MDELGKKTGSAPVSSTDSHAMTVEKSKHDSFMFPSSRACLILNISLFVKAVVVT